MALTEHCDQSAEFEALCSRLQELIAPYAGRVDYGNLRSKISRWDCGNGEPQTNIALVYETPGGSTDQINITFYHRTGTFSIVDEHCGEIVTRSVDTVLEHIRPRVQGIPQKRRETLFSEVRRQIESGAGTTGLIGHLNRMMQSELLGGTITHLEFRDAMTYAVQCMKGQASSS